MRKGFSKPKHDIWLVTPTQACWLSDISTGAYIEKRWYYEVTGETIKIERDLRLGKLHFSVRDFDDALELWSAVREAAKRGDKFFNFYDYWRQKKNADVR